MSQFTIPATGDYWDRLPYLPMFFDAYTRFSKNVNKELTVYEFISRWHQAFVDSNVNLSLRDFRERVLDLAYALGASKAFRAEIASVLGAPQTVVDKIIKEG